MERVTPPPPPPPLQITNHMNHMPLSLKLTLMGIRKEDQKTMIPFPLLIFYINILQQPSSPVKRRDDPSTCDGYISTLPCNYRIITGNFTLFYFFKNNE